MREFVPAAFPAMSLLSLDPDVPVLQELTMTMSGIQNLVSG